jgi:hypothetical protein
MPTVGYQSVVIIPGCEAGMARGRSIRAAPLGGKMPVDISNLESCIQEAERFVLRAKATLQAHKDEASLYKNDDKHTYGNGPQNAAVRRSSMDLTRALAALRKY